MVDANDFALLSPAREGDQITVVVDAAGAGRRSVVLTATTFALTPMPVSAVFDLPGGTKAGYLVLKDFLSQAEARSAAFASFRQAGATELILDLRYNGGGRVSTANAPSRFRGRRRHRGRQAVHRAALQRAPPGVEPSLGVRRRARAVVRACRRDHRRAHLLGERARRQ